MGRWWERSRALEGELLSQKDNILQVGEGKSSGFWSEEGDFWEGKANVREGGRVQIHPELNPPKMALDVPVVLPSALGLLR